MDSTQSGREDWLADLNAQQRQAVTAGDGPVLVIAGAGTGKTRTLAYRVAWLISKGVDPARILLLTFTRRAAQEMLDRASAAVSRGTHAAGRVWSGTFHAVSNRLLRMYAGAAGLDENFTVMDRSDSEDLINLVRQRLGFASRERRFPRKNTCADIYSRCVNSGDDLKTVLQHHFPWCLEWASELKALFRSYVEAKQERRVLDYDDLLLYWLRILDDEAVARSMGGRFDHILVDEYQDTNAIQAGILRGMRRNNGSIMVVGDDAQSIYGFRAANVRNILDFPSQFPGACVIKLEQNYRSVKPILEATNALLEQAAERFTKNLWSERRGGMKPVLVTCRDENEQNDYVIARVLEQYEQGIQLRRQAVLFRIGYLSDSLEAELIRRNIPYRKYGGLRFLEAAHVKDLVAFLRILENPRDELAWFRVLELLEGVGPATAERALGHIGLNGYRPESLLSFDPPVSAAEGMKHLSEALRDLSGGDKLALPAQIERIRGFYDPVFERIYENPNPRRRDLEQLEYIAGGYKSRRQFLTDLVLDPPSSTGDLSGPPTRDEDWLVLSTIHSAKGCEWDSVYLIHASDGCLPADMAAGSKEELDEELRLTYVAMTRAKDRLYVTWPLRYYHRKHRDGDAHSYAQLSRFLDDDVCARFDRATTGQEPEGDLPDAGPLSGLDIRGRMKAMWD
ncbi:MAG: ATP-dependent helicase [Lentisphaerae bacterium]|nr:ATP-dependent helicase [Lentisphaerota bacterium]